MRMVAIELGAKTLTRHLARGIVGESERIGDRLAEQGIAERQQDKPQGSVGDVMILMAHGELVDELVNRFEYPAERIAVPRQDHPCGKRPGAALTECIERHVDNIARIGFTHAGALDRGRDLSLDPVGHRAGELGLEPGRGAEVMEKVGVGPSDLSGDGFERNRLRPAFEQDSARGIERGGPAFLRAQAFSSY